MNYDIQTVYELGKQLGGKRSHASIFLTESQSFEQAHYSVRDTLVHMGYSPHDMLEMVAYVNDDNEPVLREWDLPSPDRNTTGVLNVVLWVDTIFPENITPYVKASTESMAELTVRREVKGQWEIDKVIVVYGDFDIEWILR